jgi:hypothetical protein
MKKKSLFERDIDYQTWLKESQEMKDSKKAFYNEYD